MARLQPIPLTRRNQLDQRITFDSTTPDIDVLARPVEAIERTDVSSKAKSLAKALNLFGQVGENALQSYQQIQNYDKQQGEFMAMKGDEKPTEGQALIKGYETAQGRLDSYKYQAELSAFIQENSNVLSPEEFQEGIDAITQKYLDNAPSDNYYKGFLPKAQAIEQEAILSYQQIVAEDVYRGNLNAVGGMVEGETLTFLSKNLGVSSFEEMDEIIKNDPERYQDVVAKSEVGEIHQGVREILTDIQENAEGMNIDKQTTSEIMVRRLGELATRYGLPSLMDFTNIPDESKIAIRSNPELMKVIDDYEEKAQARQDRIMEIQDIQAEKTQRDEQNRIINEATFKLADLSTLQSEKDGVAEASLLATEYQEELRQSEAYRNLPYTQVRMIENNLTKIINGENVFRTQSVKEVYSDLFIKALNGELTEEEVQANAGNLSGSNYTYLLNFMKSQEEKAEREAEAEQAAAEANARKSQEEVKEERLKYLGTKVGTLIDFVEDSITNTNEQFGTSATSYFSIKLKEFQDENGKDSAPSTELIDTWIDNYIKGQGEGFIISTYGDIANHNLAGAVYESQSTGNQLASREVNAQSQTQGDQGNQGQPQTTPISNTRGEFVNGESPSPTSTRAGFVEERQYEVANRALERNKPEEVKAEGDVPFDIDSNVIFSNMDRLRSSGATIREIVLDGERQGIFSTVPTEDGVREGMLYARAYAVQLAQQMLAERGATALDSILQTLQAEGFTYEDALNIYQEANSVVIPDPENQE